ncbi:MAG: MarR family transcriptional regulator [Leucobacter sp.]|nr:MarR family transcriptional regulator [Leucobacter sp.]
MTAERVETAIAEALAQLRRRAGAPQRGDGSLYGGDVLRGHGSHDDVDSSGNGGSHRNLGSRRGGGGHHEHGGPALRRLLKRLADEREAMSVSDIASEIGVDQPRASRLVAQGVELGLLRREADPSDARRTRIALTEQGAAHAQAHREAAERAVAAALGGFTEAEQRQLASLLARFAEAWQAGPNHDGRADGE